MANTAPKSAAKTAPSVPQQRVELNPAKKRFFSLDNLRTLVLLILFIKTTPSDKLETEAHASWADAFWTFMQGDNIALFESIMAFHANLEVPNVYKDKSGNWNLTKSGLALATTILSTNFKSSQKGINAVEVAKTSTPPYLLAVGATLFQSGAEKFMSNPEFVPSESLLYGGKDKPGMISFLSYVINLADQWGVLDEILDVELGCELKPLPDAEEVAA